MGSDLNPTSMTSSTSTNEEKLVVSTNNPTADGTLLLEPPQHLETKMLGGSPSPEVQSLTNVAAATAAVVGNAQSSPPPPPSAPPSAPPPSQSSPPSSSSQQQQQQTVEGDAAATRAAESANKNHSGSNNKNNNNNHQATLDSASSLTASLPPPPPSLNGSSVGKTRSSHRRSESRERKYERRRSYSDVPHTIEGISPHPSMMTMQQQQQQQSYMMMQQQSPHSTLIPPPPPPYGGYPMGSPYSTHPLQQHQYVMMQPPAPHPDQQFHSYGRGRAWSGDGGPIMYGSVAGSFSEGRPLKQGGPSFDAGMAPSNPPPRHNNNSNHHRREDSNGSIGSVLSHLSVGGGYGSIGGGGGAPPSPRPTPSSPRGAEFSPRHEFLNILRAPESPRTNNQSPHNNKSSNLQQQQQQSQPSPYAQGSPRRYGRQGTSPAAVPPGPGVYSPHPHGGSTVPYSPAHAAATHVTASGLVLSFSERPLVPGGNNQPSPNTYQQQQQQREAGGGSGGGEAVFLLHRQRDGNHLTTSLRNVRGTAPPHHDTGGHNKTESSRRRHMRQQSAQVYMEQVKGTPQPAMCRDLIFLLLFAFHLTGMVYLSNTYSKEALFPDYYNTNITTNDMNSTNVTAAAAAAVVPSTDDWISPTIMDNLTALNGTSLVDMDDLDESAVTINYPNLLMVAVCSGVFAMAISTTLLGVMTYFAERFIQVALVVIIGLSFVWGTVGIGVSPKNVVPITGIIALALSVAYAILVWDRIPFAASNLVTALTAIRAFPGTLVVALSFQALGCAWCIYYSIIVIGIYDSIQDGRIVLSDRMTFFAYIVLGISFYWTYQVLLNAVQVATAGVIGSWWYLPEGEHAVKHSSFKTLFYSMGSVCFGSLFVGPVLVIRQISVLFRPSSDEASLLCLHECLQCFRTCLTTCVDELAARFNPWAFTYVGLYGYGFLDAGQLATEVFDKRGWTTIVSDDLVRNLLLMASLVLGGVTGCFGYILAGLERLEVVEDVTEDDNDDDIDHEPGLVAFVAGLIIGWVITSILFGAISSSVNAVIVCFATSPVDFEQNHPELSHNMRASWREVWPGALDIVDMHLAMAQQQQQHLGSAVSNGNHHHSEILNYGGSKMGPTMGPLL